MHATAALALAALTLLPASLAAPQDPAPPGREVETWPDGRPRIEREVEAGPDGAPVAHGSWRRWHENGNLAEEGRFEHGLRDGPWRFFHENGARAAEGAYLRGHRIARWEFDWPDGKPRARGRFQNDLRDGAWTAWNSDGSPDPIESGDYAIESKDQGRNPLVRGELRAGQPHGRWSIHWSNGRVQFAGLYRDGKRAGNWRWYHPDGTFDPGFLSGAYEGDRRVGPIAPADPSPEADAGPFAEVSDPAAPAHAGAPLQNLLALKATGLKAAEERRFAEQLAAWVASGSAEDEQALREWGLPAVPNVINQMCEAARQGEPGLAVARRAQAFLLAWHGLAPGELLPAPEELGAADAPLVALRWYTLWKLAGDRNRFWKFDLGLLAQPDSGLDLHALLAEYLDLDLGRPHANRTGAYEAFALRLDLDGSGRGAGGSPQGDPALVAALDWLVRHQTAAGSWDNDALAERCQAAEQVPCEGAGHGTYDVGVTGLALLALLGAGNTRASGEHAEPLARGLAWLCGRQDPATGLIADESRSHDFLYGHALATQALCEAASFTLEPKLRAAAQRAIDACLAAQNPGAGWKYAFPPDGKSDTSLTAWMVSALAAGRIAGLEVPGSAFDGAAAWVTEATGPITGRVGYDTKGGQSSRMTGVNEHFDRETSEAMTAAGLYTRLLSGQRPGKTGEGPVIERHQHLLERIPPVWDAPGFRVDLVYWYFASQALFHIGGKPWQKWSAELRKQAVAAQRTDGCARGSWDPIDAWGMLGGRVYATAILALDLEAEVRRTRLVGGG